MDLDVDVDEDVKGHFWTWFDGACGSVVGSGGWIEG